MCMLEEYQELGRLVQRILTAVFELADLWDLPMFPMITGSYPMSRDLQKVRLFFLLCISTLFQEKITSPFAGLYL